jgi:leucyl aminopeptidase
MDIQFINMVLKEEGTLVLSLGLDNKLLGAAKNFDQKTNGQISKVLEKSEFKGKKGEILEILAPHNLGFNRIVLLGLGDFEKLTKQMLQEQGGKIFTACRRDCSITVQLATLPKHKSIMVEEFAALIAAGFKNRSFTFHQYKTKKNDEKVHLEKIHFVTDEVEKTKKIYEPLACVVEGVHLTRTVVSEPPNVLYPETMAEYAKELTKIGVQVEVFNKQDIQRLKMGGLLGVAQGSAKDPRFIVMQWTNGDKKQQPVALVGKGVTFDSGGISIKPAANMEDMKYDMAGAGVVLGTMKALALRKAKVNVVGIMAMCENMPSGSALRPADILTTMSGQTVEVQNTDAEGRLILADALWYAQDRFKPQAMIDLATLTGAIVVSLGEEYAGLFSNNHDLAARLLKCGDDVGEKVWRLPMGPEYDKEIDSVIADMKNIGSGRGGGSITAAQFLERFVNDVPWAHLDIAGTAWNKKGRPLSEKGATGFGVRLLNQYFLENFE